MPRKNNGTKQAHFIHETSIIWYISLEQSIILVTKELIQLYQAQLPLLRTSSSVVENVTILKITRCFSSYPVCSCVFPVKAIGAAVHVASVGRPTLGKSPGNEVAWLGMMKIVYLFELQFLIIKTTSKINIDY